MKLRKSNICYAIAFIAIFMVIGTAGALSEGYITIKWSMVQFALCLLVAYVAIATAIKAERNENDWK